MYMSSHYSAYDKHNIITLLNQQPLHDVPRHFLPPPVVQPGRSRAAMPGAEVKGNTKGVSDLVCGFCGFARSGRFPVLAATPGPVRPGTIDQDKQGE